MRINELRKVFSSEEGASLALILILVTLVITLGASLYITSVNQYQSTIREEDKVQAKYIAKSGANMVAGAIQNKVVDPADIDGKKTSDVSLNNGTFVVEVNDNGGNITITSTGKVGNIEEEVSLVLSKIMANVNIPDIDQAIFVDGQVNLQGGPHIIGGVGTNEDGIDDEGNPIISVDINGNPDIDGNILIGPGGSHDSVDTPGEWWTFDGVIDNLPEERHYPLPDYPAFPDDLNYYTSYTADWNPSPPYYMDYSGRYDKLIVKSELIIDIYDEDVIIRAKELSVQGSGKITVNRHGTGKLKLYVEDKFDLAGSGTINNNGNTEDVYMYYSGSNKLDVPGATKFVGSVYAETADVVIRGSGGITGNITTGGGSVDVSGNASAISRVIYAPNADITFNGSGHARGSVIGKTVTMTGGTYVTYDGSMSNINPGQLGFQQVESYTRFWQ